MRINLVVHRYEAILLILVIVMTGSINIVSTTTEHIFPLYQRYPYCVALTFDDGPYPGYTEKLLQVLEQKKVCATFFLIGRHVEKYPELANLILSKGNEIANHTYSHPNLTKLSNMEIISENNIRLPPPLSHPYGFPRSLRKNRSVLYKGKPMVSPFHRRFAEPLPTYESFLLSVALRL